MNNLYQNMENIVKSPNFTVAKDSTIYKIIYGAMTNVFGQKEWLKRLTR